MMQRILITGTGGDVATSIISCILDENPNSEIYSCTLSLISLLEKGG